MKMSENYVLQKLLGETEINLDDGVYNIDIQDLGDEIIVTVDYRRTKPGRDEQGYTMHVSATPECVFNEVYSADPYNENPFSFEQLSADLDAQNLDEVDEWIVDFFQKNEE